MNIIQPDDEQSLRDELANTPVGPTPQPVVATNVPVEASPYQQPQPISVPIPQRPEPFVTPQPLHPNLIAEDLNPIAKPSKRKHFTRITIFVILIGLLGYGIWSYSTKGYVVLGGIILPKIILFQSSKTATVTADNKPVTFNYPSSWELLPNDTYSITHIVPVEKAKIAPTLLFFRDRFVTDQDQYDSFVASHSSGMYQSRKTETSVKRDDNMSVFSWVDVGNSSIGDQHGALIFDHKTNLSMEVFANVPSSINWENDVKPAFDTIVSSITF